MSIFSVLDLHFRSIWFLTLAAFIQFGIVASIVAFIVTQKTLHPHVLQYGLSLNVFIVDSLIFFIGLRRINGGNAVENISPEIIYAPAENLSTITVTVSLSSMMSCGETCVVPTNA